MSSSSTAHLLSAVSAQDHKSSLTDVAASAPLPNVLAQILQSEGAGEEAAGSGTEENAEIVSWLSKATAEPLDSPDGLKELNTYLSTRTYLVANKRTAADIAVLGRLHPWLAGAPHSQRLTYPAVTRFLDLLQHDADVEKTGLIKIASVDLDKVPKQERVKPPPAAKTSKVEAVPIPEGAPTAKKEKKPKEKATAPAGGSSGGNKGAEDTGPRPSNIDLRVGRIVDIKRHPDAEKLYVEQIDVGEAEPRTVISGLVDYVPIEEMQNRLLVAVCNLKPVNMRGIKSHAMVLCASSKEGDRVVEVVNVPEGSQPGDKVFFEGQENEQPVEQLNPKKKIFETIQPGFVTLENRECAWRDPADSSRVLKIMTKRGICVAPSLIGASLS